MNQVCAYEALREAAWRRVSGFVPVPLRRVRSKLAPVVRRSVTFVFSPTTVLLLISLSLVLNCSSVYRRVLSPRAVAAPAVKAPVIAPV